MYIVVLIKISTLIKSYTTITASPNENKDILLNSIFHWASKPTNLLDLFLHIILYLHSLYLIVSLGLISFPIWHSPQIYLIGCCFGGWMSFWVSTVSPQHRQTLHSVIPFSVHFQKILIMASTIINFLFSCFY